MTQAPKWVNNHAVRKSRRTGKNGNECGQKSKNGVEMDLVKENGISEWGSGFLGRNLVQNFRVELGNGRWNFRVEFQSRILEFGMESEQNFGVEIWYMTSA